MLDAADQAARDIFGRLLGEEDITVDEIQHLDGDVLEALAPHQDDDRHFEAALAHQIDQRGRLAVDAALAPIDHHAADRRVGLHRDDGVLDTARPDHFEAEPLDRRYYLLDPRAFQIVRIERRRADQDREMSEKVHAPNPP